MDGEVWLAKRRPNCTSSSTVLETWDAHDGYASLPGRTSLPCASLGAVGVSGRPVSCSGVSSIHRTCSVFCSWERTKSLSLRDHVSILRYNVSIVSMIDSEHGFCLPAVCTTLSSRCLRGHSRVPSAALPSSPSPPPACTLLLLACPSEDQRRGRPACSLKSEDGPGCPSSTLTRTPPEDTC